MLQKGIRTHHGYEIMMSLQNDGSRRDKHLVVRLTNESMFPSYDSREIAVASLAKAPNLDKDAYVRMLEGFFPPTYDEFMSDSYRIRTNLVLEKVPYGINTGKVNRTHRCFNSSNVITGLSRRDSYPDYRKFILNHEAQMQRFLIVVYTYFKSIFLHVLSSKVPKISDLEVTRTGTELRFSDAHNLALNDFLWQSQAVR